jgi:hypothetical protein
MAGVISDFVDNQVSENFKLNQKQKIGIAGFYMMAVVDHAPLYSSTVSVIPLEDNSYTTDHVSQNPLFLEINGAVSDVFQMQTAPQNIYNRALAAIGAIDQYLPDYTRQQINKINQIVLETQDIINQLDSYLNSAEQLTNLFSAKTTITEQFFDVMESLQRTGQPVKVEIPYRIYSNMVISDFSPLFPSEYNDALRFRIVLTQMRFTKTIYTKVSNLYSNPAPAVKDQVTPQDDRGLNKLETVSPETASSILNNVLRDPYANAYKKIGT